MKHLSILILLIISYNLYSQKNFKYKTTKSGLKYRIIKKGNGLKCKKGLRAYINYTTKIKPDTIFDQNYGKPFAFILGQEEVLKGWDEGTLLLSEGDSAQFLIPPTLAYGLKKKGSIPANTTLELNLKVIKVEEAFYNSTSKDTVFFKNGVRKIILQEGKNEKVENYKLVTMQFTGYFINSLGYKVIFQSSKTNSTLAVFQLGAGKMVKGLDEGVATMKIGEKATFILSPDLAFGKEKNGIIPANTTVYFDIEVLSITDPFLNPINTDTIYTISGVKILPILKKDGKLIKTEDIVFYNYVAYFINTDGNPIIFDNSYERTNSKVIRPSFKSTYAGLSEGLTNLKKGEKAKIIIPSKLAYGTKGNGIIPPNQNIIYDVEIIDTKKYPFFESLGLDTIKQISGLKYISVKKGDGLAVDTGMKVSVAYTGYIIDVFGNREIFDASRESKKNLDFIIGKKMVIKGFEEGVLGMKVGEARTLIIPFQLGYGEKGQPNAGIPPKTTLYFDIELITISK